MRERDRQEGLKPAQTKYESINQLSPTKTRESGTRTLERGRPRGSRWQTFRNKFRRGSKLTASKQTTGRVAKFQTALQEANRAESAQAASATREPRTRELTQSLERESQQGQTSAVKNLLQSLVQDKQLRPKIMEEVMLPVASLEEKHGIALINAQGQDNPQKIAVDLSRLSVGEKVNNILPANTLVKERETFQDSRDFITRLEQEQADMADLALKVTEGSASD